LISTPSYRHFKILKVVRNRKLTSGLESIIQPAKDQGHKARRADDHNIVNIYKNKDTVQITMFRTEEDTHGRNRGLEAEFINYIIIDLLKIIPVCLLDTIQGFIQLHYRAGSTMWIRPFAFQKSHVGDFMESVTKECSRNVEYGYLKILFCCKAES
jgi:hypothetical protein